MLISTAANLIQHVDLPAVHRVVLAHLAPDVLGTAGSLLVTITYRTDEVSAQHALVRLERRFAETAGNPFFLHEIVHSLVEGGSIIAGQGRWTGPFVDGASQVDVPLPESIRATIGARVERLSEMARTFLQAAAFARL